MLYFSIFWYIVETYGGLFRPKKPFNKIFFFFPIIKSFVFSYNLETLIHTSLIIARSENQSVATKIQNSGSSSLTKVFTQDCLSLLLIINPTIFISSTILMLSFPFKVSFGTKSHLILELQNMAFVFFSFIAIRWLFV